MSIQDIAIQLLGLIPSIIAFTSLQTNNRKRILVLQIACCVMWAAHYGFLGAMTAVMTNAIGLFRASICYFNDRKWANYKIFPAILILLYIVSTLLTWGGWASVLPCFSMILTTFALWNHNMKLTRLLFLLNSPPLLIYNLLVGSYSCAVIECMAFISFIIAIYRFDIAKTKAQK